MLYTPTYSCYLGLQQCETDLWGFVDLEVLRCCFGVGWGFFFTLSALSSAVIS